MSSIKEVRDAKSGRPQLQTDVKSFQSSKAAAVDRLFNTICQFTWAKTKTELDTKQLTHQHETQPKN